jgi:hypothetical protein
MPITLSSIKGVFLSTVTVLGGALIGLMLGLLWLRLLRHVLPDVIVNWGGPIVALASYSVATRVLSRLTGAGRPEAFGDLWFQTRREILINREMRNEPSVPRLSGPVLAANIAWTVVNLAWLVYGFSISANQLDGGDASATPMAWADAINWPWATFVPAIRGAANDYPGAAAESLALLQHLWALGWWNIVISTAVFGILFALDRRRLERRRQFRLEWLAARLPPDEVARRDPHYQPVILGILLLLFVPSLILMVAGPAALGLSESAGGTGYLLVVASFLINCCIGAALLLVI